MLVELGVFYELVWDFFLDEDFFEWTCLCVCVYEYCDLWIVEF